MIRASYKGLLALGLFSLSMGSASAAGGNPLRVEVLPVSEKAAASLQGVVRFSMTNTGTESVRVLKYQTPFFGVEANLFAISHGPDEVGYTGVLAKRGVPQPGDWMELKAGQTQSVVVDLTDFYDFSRGGQYLVRYESVLQGAAVGRAPLEKARGVPVQLTSAPLVLQVEGTGESQTDETVRWMGVKALQAPAFVKCTTSQQGQVNTALNSARAYGNDSYGYLSGGGQGARYLTWFGTYSSGRHATVTGNFDAISFDLNNEKMTFNCGCKKNYYAYVYSNQPYQIYLCKYFWLAPNTGTDSRAGTIIHEISHFDVVAGTDDIVYGQAGAKNLAISNPANAIRNADNHEYFSENTPASPN